MPSTDEKAGEQLDVQELSSHESAKLSFQPLPNVPNAERTSATEQDKTEEPRSTEIVKFLWGNVIHTSS